MSCPGPCSQQRVSRAGHPFGGKRGGFAVPPCYPNSRPTRFHRTRERAVRSVMLYIGRPTRDVTAMPELNPTAVIAECIEKSKATADQELIADYITETLGIRRLTTPKRMLSTCSAARSPTRLQMTKSIPLVYSMSGRNSRSSGSWGSAQARYSAVSLKRLLGPAGCSRDAKSIVAFI